MKKVLIFILVLIFGLILSFVDYSGCTPKMDYTNLTQGIPPTDPDDVAIDMVGEGKEYPEWKLSKKRLTDKRRY